MFDVGSALACPHHANSCAFSLSHSPAEGQCQSQIALARGYQQVKIISSRAHADSKILIARAEAEAVRIISEALAVCPPRQPLSCISAQRWREEVTTQRPSHSHQTLRAVLTVRHLNAPMRCVRRNMVLILCSIFAHSRSVLYFAGEVLCARCGYLPFDFGGPIDDCSRGIVQSSHFFAVDSFSSTSTFLLRWALVQMLVSCSSHSMSVVFSSCATSRRPVVIR